jgi:O-antigen/teichoic acid export membrane protein
MSESVPVPEAAASPSPPDPAPAKRTGSGVGLTIARNSLWLLVDNFGGMLATLYSSVAVARHLGPDITGEWNYILWFVSVLRMVTEVAMPATVRKFAAELMGRSDYVALKTLIRRAFWMVRRLAFGGVTLGLICVMLFFKHDSRLVAALAVVTIVPGLLLSVPTGALWATENLRHSTVASLCATVVNVSGVTLSILFHWGLLGLICSQLVSRIVDCTIRFNIFRREYRRLPGEPVDRLDPALRARMIPFALQQAVTTFLYAALFDRTEVAFLKWKSTSREIAFFSLPFTLAQYVVQFPQQLSGAAGATMMVRQGRSTAEAARITAIATWFLMMVAAPALFGVAALADPLLRIAYGEKYLAAIPVLTILPIFALGQAISQPSQYLLVAAERQPFYIMWMLVAAGVGAIANLALVPHHGAVGAAIGKGASQVVAATGFLTYLVRRFHVKIPFARMVKLFGACLVMFAAVHTVVIAVSTRVAAVPMPAFWLRVVPSLAAMLAGIPLGVAIFVVLMRLLRCLDEADRDRLRQLARLVPSRARNLYLGLVRFLVPM